MKLKIGKISYANLFPIFYMLQKQADRPDYEFIEGVPSALNRMIRNGEIDISPSSSIEYLRHMELYKLIDGHSISSRGPVGSILLFSKRPIEALEGLTILTSSQSETSVALLKIILGKFYEIDCLLKPSSEPVEKAMLSHEAYLLIGDGALTEALKWPRLKIYDLGDVWYRNTGLPSVFALWIARKDFHAGHTPLVTEFITDLDRSKVAALRHLPSIAADCGLRQILSEEGLVSYWRSISYDLTDDHKRGLELFSNYARELDLL